MSFSSMVDELPPKAILAALERQRQMIEDDLLYHRMPLNEDALSVFDFFNFLDGVRLGAGIVPGAMRVKHTAFYRKIAERLVEAEELPPNAMAQFDATFSSSFFKALAT